LNLPFREETGSTWPASSVIGFFGNRVVLAPPVPVASTVIKTGAFYDSLTSFDIISLAVSSQASHLWTMDQKQMQQ